MSEHARVAERGGSVARVAKEAFDGAAQHKKSAQLALSAFAFS